MSAVSLCNLRVLQPSTILHWKANPGANWKPPIASHSPVNQHRAGTELTPNQINNKHQTLVCTEKPSRTSITALRLSSHTVAHSILQNIINEVLK